MTRPAANKGRFYPADGKSVLEMFDSFKERREERHAKNLLPYGIVPHAGYVYSGFTAMNFFLEAASLDFERVVVIGPSHHHLFTGFALSDTLAWETPLGDAEVDSKYGKLLCSDFVKFDNRIHSQEHSVEVQIPFIKYAFKERAKIVPLIMGRQNAESVNQFISLITPEMRKKTLFVASSDLHHGYSYEEAKESDRITVKEILKNDEHGFMKYFQMVESDGGCAACGGGPVAIIIGLVRSCKGRLMLLSQTTSADVTGDYDGYTVGYSSFIGVRNEERK